jgi:hypothetical protein
MPISSADGLIPLKRLCRATKAQKVVCETTHCPTQFAQKSSNPGGTATIQLSGSNIGEASEE